MPACTTIECKCCIMCSGSCEDDESAADNVVSS